MNITKEEFALLRQFVLDHSGIYLSDNKDYLLVSRLSPLMANSGCRNFFELYLKARSDTDGALKEQILDAITTNETLWFRDVRPWTVIEEVILPRFIADLRNGKRFAIRIWCAACSTGQEPYSLAMLIDRIVTSGSVNGVHPLMFDILATDISSSALAAARKGHYNELEISRGMTDYYRNRYFIKHGSTWVLDKDIRSRVSFLKHNLKDDYSRLGPFDLVLCRNVAIYFLEESKKDLFHRLACSLNPGGHLFVGASESVSGYSDEFVLLEHKDTHYCTVKRQGCCLKQGIL